MTISEMIAVLQHAERGGKVERRRLPDETWYVSTQPCWDFSLYEYRAVAKPIEWWIVVDSGGAFIGSQLTEQNCIRFCGPGERYCRMVQHGPMITPGKDGNG